MNSRSQARLGFQSTVRAIEPRLLKREQAAAYCGMAAATFGANCGVVPKRVFEGERGLRWDRFDLDRWIDSLSAGTRAGSAYDMLRLLDGEGPREGH